MSQAGRPPLRHLLQRRLDDVGRERCPSGRSARRCGMNSSGMINPRVGWRQRTSASTPTTSRRRQRQLRLVVQLELAALERGAQAAEQRRAGWPSSGRGRRRRSRRRCARPWPGTSRRRRAAAAARRRRRARGTSPRRCWPRARTAVPRGGTVVTSAVRTRWATSTAAWSSRIGASSTANSSPPSRATRSPGAGADWIRSRPRCEQAVADVVAEGVVDLLEPVEVEQAQRDAGSRRGRSRRGRRPSRASRNLRFGRLGQRVVQGLRAPSRARSRRSCRPR